ncbi:MAG: septum formation initiator family protein [Bacteroidia bacterium]|nr:septum formation initiator family protein [Bacteroidia bacterium]
MQQLWSLLQRTFLRIFRASAVKYVLLLAAAAIWLIFFDRYNLIARRNMEKQIQEQKDDKAYYESANKKLDYEQDRINSDLKETERLAREKYYMKRADEDVYIVVDSVITPR